MAVADTVRRCLLTQLLLVPLGITIVYAGVTILFDSNRTREGHWLNMTCIVTGQSFVKWTGPDGQAIPSDWSERKHVESRNLRHQLIVTRVNRTDSGIYRCHGDLESKAVRFYVHYPPSLISDRSTTEVIWTSFQSDPIELKCTFDGYPVATVKFYKDGKLIKDAVSIGGGSARYRFRATNIDDCGFYTCKGLNSEGEASHYIEVAKYGPAEPPPNIELSVGCESVHVTWKHKPISQGSAVTSIKIELRLQGGSLIKREGLKPSMTSRTYRDLERGVDYKLRMTAVNQIGSGPWSEHSFATKNVCGKSAKTLVSLIILSIVTLVAIVSV